MTGRVKDVMAYSLTGTGDMNEHLKRIIAEGEANSSRWLLLLLAGLGALAAGSLLQA